MSFSSVVVFPAGARKRQSQRGGQIESPARPGPATTAVAPCSGSTQTTSACAFHRSSRAATTSRPGANRGERPRTDRAARHGATDPQLTYERVHIRNGCNIIAYSHVDGNEIQEDALLGIARAAARITADCDPLAAAAMDACRAGYRVTHGSLRQNAMPLHSN